LQENVSLPSLRVKRVGTTSSKTISGSRANKDPPRSLGVLALSHLPWGARKVPTRTPFSSSCHKTFTVLNHVLLAPSSRQMARLFNMHRSTPPNRSRCQLHPWEHLRLLPRRCRQYMVCQIRSRLVGYRLLLFRCQPQHCHFLHICLSSAARQWHRMATFQTSRSFCHSSSRGSRCTASSKLFLRQCPCHRSHHRSTRPQRLLHQ